MIPLDDIGRIISVSQFRLENSPGLRRVSAQSQDEHKFDCEREH